MPREDPVDYIPIALMHSVSDVTASYMPIWRNYSIEENAYAFARSIGATAFQNFKTKEEQDIFSSFFNSLIATFQNVGLQKSRQQHLITFSIRKSSEALKLQRTYHALVVCSNPLKQFRSSSALSSVRAILRSASRGLAQGVRFGLIGRHNQRLLVP